MSKLETNKDFENVRRELLKNKLSSKTEEQKPQNTNPEEGQEKKVENSEKKLDIDQKNSYIDSTENQNQNDETEKLKSVLENTFGGDPLKAAKSWKEAQSYAAQLRQKLKDMESETNAIYDVVEKNPKLQELFEKAHKGEDIENFFRSKEPEGKPASSMESQLDSSISEKQLYEAGIVKPSELEFLSEAQKSERLNQARLVYQQRTLPKTIAQQAAVEFQRQIEENDRKRKEADEQRTNKQLNQNRWKSGIEEAAETFGLHFAGEDNVLLDEIERYASYYRDPDNPNVIDEKAVYLAAQRVLMQKGRDYTPRNYKKVVDEAKKENSGKFDTGFSVNKRQPDRQTQPQGLFDKVRQRRLEQSKQSIEKRYSYRRTD